jgi:Zn-dependent peptidase ImmA (M78 family)
MAGLLGELYSHLRPCDDDSPGRIPRLRLSVGTVDELELVDEGIRVDWDLGNHPIDDRTALMEQHHIVVASINDKPAPIGSFSTWTGNVPWLFPVASVGMAAQTRLDAAHELGHLIMRTSQDVGTALAPSARLKPSRSHS